MSRKREPSGRKREETTIGKEARGERCLVSSSNAFPFRVLRSFAFSRSLPVPFRLLRAFLRWDWPAFRRRNPRLHECEWIFLRVGTIRGGESSTDRRRREVKAWSPGR